MGVIPGVRNWARRAPRGSAGFTLLELVIAVSLISVATGIVGSAIFRVTSIQRFWTDDALATKDLRHAGSWFAGDAMNSDDALGSDGSARLACNPNPPEREVTLTWTGTDGSSHSARYHVTQGDLVRDFDGSQLILTGRIVGDSLSFSLCDGYLTLAMEVDADRNTTESLSLRTFLRKLQ